MKFGFFQYRSRPCPQAGYFMMVLLLMVALLMIATLAAAPKLAQEIRREREEEMIHRGAQYARAIKRYYRKFGRYPGSVDQLIETNHVRFLRKRYKDPMTPDGKWQLVYFGQFRANTKNQPGQPGTPASQLAGGSSSDTQSQSGANPSGSSFGSNIGPATAGPSSLGSSSPGLTGGAFGSGSSTGGGSSLGSTFGGTSSPGGASVSTAGGTATAGSAGLAGQVMGGTIVGVTSKSEKESIKVFNEKKHYNEWVFVFDPNLDRGELIKGPYTGKTFGMNQSNIPGATPAGALGQQPGQLQQSQPLGQQSPMQPSSPNPR